MGDWWKRMQSNPWFSWAFVTLFLCAIAWWRGGPYWPGLAGGALVGLWQAGWNRFSHRWKESRRRRQVRFLYRVVPFLVAMLAVDRLFDPAVDGWDMVHTGVVAVVGALVGEAITPSDTWP